MAVSEANERRGGEAKLVGITDIGGVIKKFC